MNKHNRDEVLAFAMGKASVAGVQLVYKVKWDGEDNWCIQDYGKAIPQDADNSSIRYVMANGEVTKLS